MYRGDDLPSAYVGSYIFGDEGAGETPAKLFVMSKPSNSNSISNDWIVRKLPVNINEDFFNLKIFIGVFKGLSDEAYTIFFDLTNGKSIISKLVSL